MGSYQVRFCNPSLPYKLLTNGMRKVNYDFADLNILL